MVSRLDILNRMAQAVGPHAPGPIGSLPAPVRAALPLIPGMGGVVQGPGAALAELMIGAALDNPVGKAATGAGAAVQAQVNPFLNLFPNSQGAQLADRALAAYEAAPGNPFEKARAANEAAASGGKAAALTTGASNAVLDPLNLLGPLGKGLQGTKAARLGSLLSAVDEAQAMPLELLAAGIKKGGSAAQKAALARRLVTDVEKTTGKAGSIPEHLLPMVGGQRQFGPIPPPPLFGYNAAKRGDVPARELIPGIGGDGGKGIGPLLPPELGPELPPLQGPADPGYIRKNVPPAELIPGIGKGGKPGIGPVLPPSQDVPLPPELGPRIEEALRGNAKRKLGPELPPELGPPSPNRSQLPELYGRRGNAGKVLGPKPPSTQLSLAEAVRQVMPAPTLPGGDRASILGGLKNDELDLLGDLAYPHENAINNAVMKHGGTEGLASAALERLTRDRDKMSHLGSINPELARKLALLPEPPGAALPDATPDQLDELIAETTQRATPPTPPKNVDIPAGMGDIAAGGGGGGMGIVANRGGLQLLPPLNGPVPQGLRKVASDVGENVRAIAGLAREAAGEGVKANATAREAGKGGKFLPSPGDFYGYWKRTTVEHPKNLAQDEIWVRLVTRALQGGDASDIITPLRREMQGRLGLTGREALPQSELDELDALGLGDYTPEYGQALAASEQQAAKELSRVQRTVANVGLSVLNPASVITTPLGLAASAARGFGDAGWSGFFQSLNGVLQHTARIAIARSERNYMLREADSLLRQTFGIADGALPEGGLYSPQRVEQVAGKEAADRWAAFRDTAVQAGEQRAKALLGDYSDEGKRGWERALGGAVPFVSWAVRAYPVALQMALHHPLVALGVYHYLQATTGENMEPGQPSYTAGMIPIDDDTPFVGAIARYLLGGAEGTAYVDPVGSFSPVGGELFQTPDEGGDKNWYQQANAGLGRVGLPQIGPQGAIPAYALGLDFKAPSMGSRTRGIEEALALVPGNVQLPNVGASALREVRGYLSPRAEGQIPGAEGDKNPEAYDPITRRYAELVMQETGKPLNDPANVAYLAALADPENALAQRARREVLLGGAARNVASLTSPVYAAAQTDPNKAYRAVAKDVPYTYDDIKGAETYPRLRTAMEQANAGYRQAHPAVDTYKIGGEMDAAYELLRQFENANKDFAFVAPAAYARALRAKKVELGLIEPQQQRTGTR